MMMGVITTRHVILHPVTLIQAWGFKGYLRLIMRCLDQSHHCFTDFFLL
jgi:hypothetical protein